MVTGVASALTTIDGVVLSKKKQAGFVLAFETDGKLAWAEGFGDESLTPMSEKGRNEGATLAIAEDGSIVIGGAVHGGSVFGSKPVALAGTMNPFIAVLERDGTPRWSQVMASSMYGLASGVAAASNGFVYFTGWFSDDLRLGPTKASSAGGDDMFLMRIAP